MVVFNINNDDNDTTTTNNNSNYDSINLRRPRLRRPAPDGLRRRRADRALAGRDSCPDFVLIF